MTTTNAYSRQPTKQDYADPTKFKFSIAKLPKVEYFCTQVNLPGISISDNYTQPTPFRDIPLPGEKLRYEPLSVTFLVDENLENYKELHDWIIGLGAPQKHSQFSDFRALSTDRFSGSKPLPEGGMYADATLTVLNSKNIAVTEIRFQNIFPTSLGSLSYDVQASDVDYLSTSVDFSYMYYEIVQL